MVHVMAPALAAIARKAMTAMHVIKVFFIEISSLQLTFERYTREKPPFARDPITSRQLFFPIKIGLCLFDLEPRNPTS
jgi:hypothetical protein